MKVLVSGGGTGGHIYPAIALINKIRKEMPDSEFLYIGTEKGLESQIVPKADIPFKTITIQGFKRSLSFENIKTVLLFLKGIKESKKMIKDFQPDVVMGTGGYVCAPVVYAAHKCGIPTIIHEQNSVPGMTNKFLARYVDRIGICFKDAAQYFPKEKVVLTGNPRGEAVANIEKSTILETYGLKSEEPTVLVFGGSRGALSMTNAMCDALEDLSERNYQILYATGDIYFESVQKILEDKKIKTDKLAVVAYINNMEQVLVNVDLVVSRAGATTIAEITSLGIPSLLIPSPNVTNDHQTKNANSLVSAGASVLLKDSEMTGQTLLKELDAIMENDELREKMAQASKKEGIPDATSRLLSVVNEIR